MYNKIKNKSQTHNVRWKIKPSIYSDKITLKTEYIEHIKSSKEIKAWISFSSFHYLVDVGLEA